MTQIVADNFTSGGRGSPNAWSPASDGNNWTVDAGSGTISIVSNQGKLTGITAQETIHLGSATSIDFDVVVRVKVNSGNYSAAGIIARQTGTTTYYRARLSSAANTFGIVKTIAGTTTNLSIPSFTVSTSTEYWIRFKGVGANLFAMIWADGSAVPNTWFATANDTSITIAGTIGVHANTSNSADIALFDNFYAADYPNFEIADLSSFAGDATVTLTNSFNTTITDSQLSSFVADATTLANFSFNTTITDSQLSSFVADATVQKTNEITEQLTSFSAEASVAWSYATVSTGIHVFISGQEVKILEGSFEIDDAINTVSTCSFTVRDDSGTNHYTKRQKVVILDSVKGLVFTGFINSVEEDRQSPQTMIFAKVDVRDNHDLAEKRTYPGPDFTNAYAGTIATSLLDVLAEEGVSAPYASRRDTTQGQFNLGTLSGVIATANVDDGDLELAPAGSDVTILESTTSDFSSGSLTNVTAASNTLAPTAINAVKITGTMNIPGLTNASAYIKIWSGSYTFSANDYIGYYVWVDSTSPEIKAAVDVVCSDGTRMQDQIGLPFSDFQNDLLASPLTDLAGYANGQWYYRTIHIGHFSGKTAVYASVALGGQAVGNYAAYFRNITIFDSGTLVTNATIFASSMNVSPQQVQVTGYNNLTCSVVPTYNLQRYSTANVPGDTVAATIISGDAVHERVSSSYSLNAATILKGGVITWDAIEPANTKFVAKVALDNGYPVECTNVSPVPDLIAGMNLTGRSISLYEDFYFLDTVTNPESAPTLNSIQVTATSAPAATKTDITYNTVFASGETGVTFTNTVTNGAILNLIGSTRNWNLSIGNILYDQDQAPFLGTAGDTIFQRAYQFGNPSAGNESKTKFTFAGQHQNFIAEVEVQLIGDQSMGLVYRSTALSTNNGSYAYAVFLSTTGIALKKRTNSSGGGAATSLQTAAFTLANNSWHRIKVSISGSNHSIYLDDVLQFTKSDGTYTATGYLGVVGVSPTIAAPQFNFDNFGVVDSLSGTWLSPSTSLTSAGTYGTSYIAWRDRSQNTGGNNIILVETSINGGSSWQTATNGGAIASFSAGQSLSGVSLQIRVTLTTTTAQSMPGIDNLYCVVMGAYSASGNRISPSLPLTDIGRLSSSVVAWNALTPTNTTLGVDIRFNGGAWFDVTSANGQPWPSLTGQPDPTVDTFDTDTSANYTASHRTGGTDVTATFDTSNSRLVLAGGTSAFYVANSPTTAIDFEVLIDMDRSDSGGVVWVYQNTDNFIEMIIADDTASSNPNTISVFRCNGGTRNQQGGFTSINFVRGSYHRFKLHYDYNSHIATIYMDGTVALTTTSISSGSSGRKIGLRNSGGTDHYYSFWIQPLGVDVSTYAAQTRLRLSSTDPTATPQVTDHTVAGYGATMRPGALIPQTDYIRKYINDNFDDLIKQSSIDGTQWWWSIDKNLTAYMLPGNGMPAPWIASSVLNADLSADFLDSGLNVTDESDLYRNRQIITNVMDTAAIDRTIAGDGVSRTWTFQYGWASAPTITVNGVPATVGVKGTDTGKTFYYAVDDPVIAIDDSIGTYTSAYSLRFVGNGQFLSESQYDDLVGQSIVRSRDGTSGIVENVEDGTGLTKAAGDALAQSRVKQFGILGKKLDATTLREGLTPGMLLPAFLPEHGLFDTWMLIRSIKTTLTPDGATGLHKFWYTIEAISGADIGPWELLYLRKDKNK